MDCADRVLWVYLCTRPLVLVPGSSLDLISSTTRFSHPIPISMAFSKYVNWIEWTPLANAARQWDHGQENGGTCAMGITPIESGVCAGQWAEANKEYLTHRFGSLAGP